MTKEMSEIIKEKNKINNLYRTIWINALMQFKESNNELGVHFWLQRKNDENYVMFYFGNNGLTENELKMNDQVLSIIETMLQKDGFESIKTENNRTLLMIWKEKIISYIKKDNNRQSLLKMPITPFSETRHRN